MIGAIVGDVVGSFYESRPNKSVDFPFLQPGCAFTDDTVLTVATAHAILSGEPYGRAYLDLARRYPRVGYGGSFRKWVREGGPQPYGSFGNGSAMRVSPVGFAFSTLEETLKEAELSACATHNHPEGIKGAQATAGAIFLARTGSSKQEIEEYITGRFAYQVQKDLDYLRDNYEFNETCQQTVPEAVSVFLQSNNFEDAIRKAVSIGGDSDTVACIVGGIAEAFYGEIPEKIKTRAVSLLDDRLKGVLSEFSTRFGVGAKREKVE